MKKTVIVLFAFIGMILMSFAFTRADQPRYKNLKVLSKNTTKEEMDSIMKHFTASLGVKCGFCHAYNQEQKSMDFASDEKKNKAVARDMMRMTNKINRKYFKEDKDRDHDDHMHSNLQAVTCYSCHHGQEHPAQKPMAMQGERRMPQGGQGGQPMQGAPQERQPQANQQ